MRLVVGIGNPDRGDDDAGRLVARRLRALAPPAFEVRECDGEATALMEAWAGWEDVVLVDACRGAGPCGSVHTLDRMDLAALDALRHASTHSFGVVAALGLARALGRHPRDLALYAIEGRRFDQGAGLSPEVEQAVGRVVRLLLAGGRRSRGLGPLWTLRGRELADRRGLPVGAAPAPPGGPRVIHLAHRLRRDLDP